MSSIREHLESLASAANQATYLNEMHLAASVARDEYTELVRLSGDHPDPAVRCDALTVIFFMATPNFMDVLNSSRRDDPSEMVRGCAEALFFRALAAARQRALGKFDADWLTTYQQTAIAEAIAWRFGGGP